MSIEKLIGELTDEIVSLRKVMQANVDLMTALTEKTAAATGVAADKPARASRAKAKPDAEDKAPAKEKEPESRGRGDDHDDRDDRDRPSRDRDDDRRSDRDDDRGSRSRDDDKSRGDKDRDDRGGRSGSKDRESTKALDAYELASKFLDYGNPDDKEDEDERDRRTDFLDRVLKYLDVNKVRDIPEKEAKNLKRWFALYEDDKRVDFDRD